MRLLALITVITLAALGAAQDSKRNDTLRAQCAIRYRACHKALPRGPRCERARQFCRVTGFWLEPMGSVHPIPRRTPEEVARLAREQRMLGPLHGKPMVGDFGPLIPLDLEVPKE
jgi:hypothetical protein